MVLDDKSDDDDDDHDDHDDHDGDVDNNKIDKDTIEDDETDEIDYDLDKIVTGARQRNPPTSYTPSFNNKKYKDGAYC